MNKTLYSILLIAIYILYIKYHNSDCVKNIINIEPFKSSKNKELGKINNSLNLLRENIVDLASIAKHNTTNICKIKKNMGKTPFISL